MVVVVVVSLFIILLVALASTSLLSSIFPHQSFLFPSLSLFLSTTPSHSPPLISSARHHPHTQFQAATNLEPRTCDSSPVLQGLWSGIVMEGGARC